MSKDNNKKDDQRLTSEEAKVFRLILLKYQISPMHFMRLLSCGFQAYQEHDLCTSIERDETIFLTQQWGSLFHHLEQYEQPDNFE